MAKTPRDTEAIIEELYTKMGMGCKKIASQTVRPLYRISHVGVLRVLRRLGFVASKEKKRWKSFRAPHKNHMWQIDLLGPLSTLFALPGGFQGGLLDVPAEGGVAWEAGAGVELGVPCGQILASGGSSISSAQHLDRLG